MTRVPYVSTIGILMYVMLCTQPNICFLVGLVNHYQSNSSLIHWKVVKRIFFFYIQRARDFILYYLGGDLRLRGCCGTNWVSDKMSAYPLQDMLSYLIVPLLLGANKMIIKYQCFWLDLDILSPLHMLKVPYCHRR